MQQHSVTENPLPLDEIREDFTQRFRQVLRTEPFLTQRLCTRPGSIAGKEKFLLFASLRPGDSSLKVT